ncbi:MAG: hypothetical protein WC389_21560 [Lutibacter sp.]|jgi:hypothetical protein
MKKITIEIETTNKVAFEYNGDYELRRILKNTREKVAGMYDQDVYRWDYDIKDSRGNKCGKLTVE